MQTVESFFNVINNLTWGQALIPLLVVFGLFITGLSRFVQFQFFGRMFRVIISDNQTTDPNTISSRAALLISVGGRVGGGNIAGVAVAITLGGPGAVFWMWAIALVGMATSLVESTLAQIFKRKQNDGSFRGGPARSILHGLGENYRWLAIVYSVCLIAAFGLGFNAFQGNTVAGALKDSLGISRMISGALLAVIAGFIVFGGIKRIAKVADVVVPLMAISYIAMALVVIILNISEVPSMLQSILANAFGFEEAVSGGMGAAISQGLRRGLFSNEAGLGSTPNVAATADVKHPISQGITQSLSVFIDTMLVCTCTAFIILLGDIYVPGNEAIDGVVLTQQSLVSHLGNWTKYFLSAMLLLFCVQLNHLQLLPR
ncbi:MAG: alanine/glycine:cation symporter family protein [Enterobacterales bacterium]|nr:alanine/glycine:cation symporter family protein [Enterobacterales bacterium]